MSEIKRYMPYHQRNMMLEHNKGRFVEHTTHLAALKQARIDVARELIDKFEKAKHGDVVRGSLSLAQGICKKHIEQLKEQGE